MSKGLIPIIMILIVAAVLGFSIWSIIQINQILEIVKLIVIPIIAIPLLAILKSYVSKNLGLDVKISWGIAILLTIIVCIGLYMLNWFVLLIFAVVIWLIYYVLKNIKNVIKFFE